MTWADTGAAASGVPPTSHSSRPMPTHPSAPRPQATTSRRPMALSLIQGLTAQG
uniref:hypothetical protein n=1 Tax=Prochlorothrix hollandica TaxID=1223 RepID=UPI001375AACA